jgi:hypothetical protein
VGEEMKNKIKICDLPNGCIIWSKHEILGVTGLSLSSSFKDKYCVKIDGNCFDYELVLESESDNK